MATGRPNIELRQIRYFVAVAEEGNLGAAARKLHISQPPITRQIRKLEQEVGGELFTRTPRGVELTDAGHTFLGEARRILANIDRAVSRSRAAHAGQIGELDVGFMGSAIYSTIPKILQHFREEMPLATVSLSRLSKQDQIDGLRNGHLHVGFSRYYPDEPDLVLRQVELDPPALAVSKNVKDLKSPVRLRQLANSPFIVFPSIGRPSFADEVMSIFKRARVKPNIAYTAEDLTSALALTAAGLGACLVPASVSALKWPGVRFLKIDKVAATIPVQCVYLHGNESPVLLSFLNALERYGEL